MDRKPLEFLYPFKGIDENWAFRRQPEGTTPDALNVRPFDGLEHRARGGQRGGLSKYVADTVNGVNRIQALGQVTVALDPSAVTADTLLDAEPFTYANGLLSTVGSTKWDVFEKAAGAGADNPGTAISWSAAGTHYPSVDTNKCSGDFGADNYITASIHKTVLDPGEVFVIECDFLWNTGLTGGSTQQQPRLGFLIRVPSTLTPSWDEFIFAGMYSSNSATNFLIQDAGGTPSSYNASTLVNGAGWKTATHTMRLEVNGNIMRFYVDDTLYITATNTGFTSNTRWGFTIGDGATNATTMWMDNLTLYTGRTPASLRTTKLVAVSGGSVYAGDSDGLSIPTGGSSVLHSNRILKIQDAFGKMYFCDGLASGYQVYDPAVGTVSTWTPTAGTLPIGSVDDTLGCRLIALYRGRVVLAGLSEEPQNWFMSRAGDPLDWDYGASPVDATMAVAGNSSDAGELGDVVTALAPYSDDMMVIGGDHTLWLMRGDPAAGGVLDNISYQTGIAGPSAFAWDPNGALYFVGAGVLWRMAPGQTLPEPLSRGRLDKVFDAIDYDANRIVLLWDRYHVGLHVFTVPVDGQLATAPVHIYWDQRTDSFWKDQYPAAMGPSAVHIFDADLPSDRAALIGGWDSYIRFIDNGEETDDGTPINSYVDFTPKVLAGDLANMRLTELEMILAADSDPVRLEVYGESTAEALVDSPTLRFSKRLTAGRNPAIRQRVNSNALKIRLVNDAFSDAWVTGTVYAVNDTVIVGTGTFRCIVAHTSTTGGSHPTPPGNETDWVATTPYTWAMESLTGVLAMSGKTRHGRL